MSMRSAYLEATDAQREAYLRNVRALGSISRLYSESDTAYIDYRNAENAFCEAFGAENLSRLCIAVDARIGDLGIGIKTFVNTPYQKIAEFDKDSGILTGEPEKDATIVAELRNGRMDLARNGYGIEHFIYHYIVRSGPEISFYECPMDYIDIPRIRLTKSDAKGFDFVDGRGHYRFTRAKSVLYKKFDMSDPLMTVGVDFIEDPLNFLVSAIGSLTEEGFTDEVLDFEPAVSAPAPESVILPLYSVRKGVPFVPQRSGLNQWNAGGRPRNPDEVYIPVPVRIRRDCPSFFPPRYEKFDLELPDGKVLSASICQEDGKALMSDPNRDLGHWILRKVLKLEPHQLVTMDLLNRLGVNAVVVTKHPDRYRMDFTYVEDAGDAVDLER